MILEEKIVNALQPKIFRHTDAKVISGMEAIVSTVVQLIEEQRKLVLEDAAVWFEVEYDGQEMHGSRVAEMLIARAAGQEYKWE